jgi:hypothetical protein
MEQDAENSTTARPFRFAPPCAECGQEGATLEVIAPGGLPERWADWSEHDRALHLKYTDASAWRRLYEGIVGGSGVVGDPITEEGAAWLLSVVEPFDLFAVQRRFYDNLGYCVPCGKPYCLTCWRVSVGGHGWCPRGHDDVLDPW